MGIFSPKPLKLSSYQNPIDDVKSGWGPCCRPVCARTGGRRREQIKRVAYVLLFLSLVGFLDYLSTTWGEIEIQQEFGYPLNIPNFPEVVEEFRFKVGNFAYTPINFKYSSIDYIHKALSKNEKQAHGLLVLVKSAIKNFEKRESIRQTWGQLQYLEDAKIDDNLPSKLLFICGVPRNSDFDSVEELFPQEWDKNDIIVADFLDEYGNNTYKSLLALRWASQEFQSDFQYLLLVDDDMYVDLVNLSTYLRNFPKRTFEEKTNLPGSQFPIYRMSTKYKNNHTLITGNNILQKGLYMGQIYWNATPLRESYFIFQARRREWGVQLGDYMYNFYPPYAPGAAIIFSKEAVHKFYYASFFVKHFAIDDVYLGIIAKKLELLPVHNPHFYACCTYFLRAGIPKTNSASMRTLFPKPLRFMDVNAQLKWLISG
ncbi:beta-1,3-galactosyltransferase brn isoform X2 [Folsomia candida]|uniref:beta-1,3-galactosyltransferase brn isoform X2 n=1 Tax=Folsomia candida TaxID=158441 RepID=UPI001604AE56|nr:beta-1,3-galactosyltransferase brn isoform X2 [Folsomia candida]